MRRPIFDFAVPKGTYTFSYTDQHWWMVISSEDIPKETICISQFQWNGKAYFWRNKTNVINLPFTEFAYRWWRLNGERRPWSDCVDTQTDLTSRPSLYTMKVVWIYPEFFSYQHWGLSVFTLKAVRIYPECCPYLLWRLFVFTMMVVHFYPDNRPYILWRPSVYTLKTVRIYSEGRSYIPWRPSLFPRRMSVYLLVTRRPSVYTLKSPYIP